MAVTSESSPMAALLGPSCPSPSPELTFTGEAVPSEAQAAGTAVGAGGIEAVSAQATQVLLEGTLV